jgi:uncharacterized protein (DUF305 family)
MTNSIQRRTIRRRTVLSRVAVVAATVTAVAGLAACGSSSGGGHGSMPMGTGSSAPAGTASAAFNDADVAFAQAMIPHHRQAVDMATLADTGAADPQVKQLAAQIKAAQDPEIQTMTGWLAAWGKPTTMPSTTPSTMPGMNMGGASAMPGMGPMPGMMSDADMAKLKAASGKNFDKQFCTMMIAHHQGAIEMAKQEQATGANPDAKALAERIATSQQGEIDSMNKILARL